MTDLFDPHRLAKALGGEVAGGQILAPGPGHSAQDRSLAVRLSPDAPEGFVVHSFAGDDALACRDHVRSAAGLPDWRDRERSERRVTRAAPRPLPEHRPDPAALTIWRGATSDRRTVAAYLQGRGITIDAPPTLRQCAAMRGRTPVAAMVAAVQCPAGKVIAVQQTFLTWDGRKLPTANPRITTGALGLGAVRLAPVTDILGLAEGIETALSAMQMTGFPCWSVLGAQRLGKIAIPPSVRHVHIFADADEPGRRAADAAAERFTRAGAHVRLRWPPEPYGDWNDFLQARQAVAE